MSSVARRVERRMSSPEVVSVEHRETSATIRPVRAADCKTATVGLPFNDCFDIYTAAKITPTQFSTFNPGLDCNTLQKGRQQARSKNGTCYEYHTVAKDTCAAIAVKFDVTTADLELWNKKTYKWKGCNNLQVGFTMCVSPGTPPPIPVNPNLQCGPESPLTEVMSRPGKCDLPAQRLLQRLWLLRTHRNLLHYNWNQSMIPTCSPKLNMRHMGYYEGWAAKRPCGAVSPSQGMEIQLSANDAPLLKELVAQKKFYPNLKVSIAVGGWAFSEDDATRDLFSVMIASASTRATFITSVKKFISTYSVDGFDIDFELAEYPGAVERSAPATDTPNLTAFFKELRAALPSGILISCAAPATLVSGVHSCAGGTGASGGSGTGSGGSGNTGTGNHFYSVITWNPNPYPATSAKSETFVGGGSTLVIPVPTASRVITIDGEVITLNAGGTRINALVPTGISQPNAITPTWCTHSFTFDADLLSILIAFHVEPPATATIVTFTAPLSGAVTFSTAVAVPASPGAPTKTIAGPPGEKSCNSWKLSYGPALNCLPADVGIPGGVTPTATPPVGWIGVWTDPVAPHSVTTVAPEPSFTIIEWSTIFHPNPYPPSTAKSETFIDGASALIIPMPTSTTTATIHNLTFVLGSGGTPLISCGRASDPTYTFTAPLTSIPTWTTRVPVPPSSDSPEQTVRGPPGDKTSCHPTNIWNVLFGGIIRDCLPLDVGIKGGITPMPIPPPGWTAPWDNPYPIKTPGSGEEDGSSSSRSSSSSSTAACRATQAPVYNLPDDAENADWDDDGLDPDYRRKRAAIPEVRAPLHRTCSQSRGPAHQDQRMRHKRHSHESKLRISQERSLLDHWSQYSWNKLSAFKLDRDPPILIIIPLGLISQFFNDAPMNSVGCQCHMVFADTSMNQAKSNVVNRNRATAADPPKLVELTELGKTGSFTANQDQIQNFEFFIRNFAALGSYWDATSPLFLNAALKVQMLLSEITPKVVPDHELSIPGIFNEWLEKLLSPTTFSSSDLVPLPPKLAKCNVPGTVGAVVGLLQSSTAQPPITITLRNQVIMGAGSMDYYAVGSGTSLRGSHWQIFDLAGAYGPVCNGAYELRESTAQSVTAFVDFSCSSFTGARNAPFSFVFNKLPLSECSQIHQSFNDGTQLSQLVCGTASVDNCVNHISRWHRRHPHRIEMCLKGAEYWLVAA
ncbi:hypothetical protein B0H13DRAFT_1910385 [Mycena leptocephala]|nr:hypothetical protein B0H13DRAFT_1910385 [Mycena leptocephala]